MKSALARAGGLGDVGAEAAGGTAAEAKLGERAVPGSTVLRRTLHGDGRGGRVIVQTFGEDANASAL